MTATGVREASRELAAALGQGVRRTGPRSWEAASRTRLGHGHHVAWTMDGDFICNCEAASLGKRECWAVKFVREEFSMSVEYQAATAERLPAIQVLTPTELLPSERTYALIEKAASLALKGAVALPKELNSPEKVAAVMLYGWELGLRPMTAIQELYIVNGRVQPSARVMAGLFESRTDGHLEPIESTDKKCTMRIVWPSRHIDATWTCEWPEIEKAKLASREVWQTYPRDKLITHTTKRILRIFAPGIINGLIGPVIGAVSDEDEDFDERELFNPGEPEGVVVDHETGEIIDRSAAVDAAEAELGATQPEPEGEPPHSPGTAAPPPDRKALTDAINKAASALQTTLGPERYKAEFLPDLFKRWPATNNEGKPTLATLDEAELAAVLEFAQARHVADLAAT